VVGVVVYPGSSTEEEYEAEMLVKDIPFVFREEKK